MCGIAALVAAHGTSWRREDLEPMRTCLHHRGPDASGSHTWPPADAARPGFQVGLAHTRLSIIDTSDQSNQPMRDDATSVSLTFNGEIYNYLELREELRRAGHRFTTGGDTEVLLRAYLEWGSDCLSRLVGMYAFVVHDPRSRTVLAARDPFGIKPLYLARTTKGIAFASELKAFRHLEGVDHSLNRSTVLRYIRFASGRQGDETIFAGIQEVGSGCHVVVSTDDLHLETLRHYTFAPAPLSTDDISFEEAAGELRARFLRSVELHSRSDVPVGAALSGGVDSSSIICALREVSGPGSEIHAFSYAAADSALDESAWAAMAAERSNATLHRVAPAQDQFLRDLDHLVTAWDEPVPSTSVYAQYCIFRAAREAGITVLLDGQGADELLGGYERYVGARIATLVRERRWGAALRLSRASRVRGFSTLGTVSMTADFLAPARVQQLVRPLVGRPLIPRWLDVDWFSSGGVAGLGPVHHTKARRVLHDQLSKDLTEVGVPFLLRNEDRNSMIWSVESRVPFLVPDVAEFCVSLPEEYLVDDRATSKSVFKRAVEGLVPQPILDRQDKIGFEAPAVKWFAALGDDALRELTTEATETLPFVRGEQVGALWDAAAKEAWSAENAWRLIFLTRWIRTHGLGVTT